MFNNLKENFIEYIGISKDIDKSKLFKKSIFETDLVFEKELSNIEISKIYANLTIEDKEFLEDINTIFYILKIDISIEYIDEDKFGMIALKKFINYKTLYFKTDIGDSLNIKNNITNIKFLELQNNRYYIYINIHSSFIF